MNIESTAVNQIFMVSVDEIKAADFQPPDRTERRRLKALMREIKALGKIVYPLIVAGDGRLADGHRRLTCARALGFTHVPVMFESEDAQRLFSSLNTGTQIVTGKDWGSAVAYGLPVDCVRGPNRRRIEGLLRVLGPEDYADIISRRSPDLFGTATAIAKYVGRESDDEYIRRCVLWIDKHNMTRAPIDAMKQMIAPQMLAKRIDDDEPLRIVYG